MQNFLVTRTLFQQGFAEKLVFLSPPKRSRIYGQLRARAYISVLHTSRASFLNLVVFQSPLFSECPPVRSHFISLSFAPVLVAEGHKRKNCLSRDIGYSQHRCVHEQKKHHRKERPSKCGSAAASQAEVKSKENCVRHDRSRRHSMRNRRQASSGFLVTQVNHFLHFMGRGDGRKAPREDGPRVGTVLHALRLYERPYG